MWKTSGLLIYAFVPRSFCEILRGGLFLHFFPSRFKKSILVNCIYGIISLTGRGRGYVRWPCLVTKLCPDPALSSGPAQLTSMAWGSGQSKPSLFHLKNCYNMISFFFLLEACCFLGVILVVMKWKNPKADFVMWWRRGEIPDCYHRKGCYSH